MKKIRLHKSILKKIFLLGITLLLIISGYKSYLFYANLVSVWNDDNTWYNPNVNLIPDISHYKIDVSRTQDTESYKVDYCLLYDIEHLDEHKYRYYCSIIPLFYFDTMDYRSFFKQHPKEGTIWFDINTDVEPEKFLDRDILNADSYTTIERYSLIPVNLNVEYKIYKPEKNIVNMLKHYSKVKKEGQDTFIRIDINNWKVDKIPSFEEYLESKNMSLQDYKDAVIQNMLDEIGDRLGLKNMQNKEDVVLFLKKVNFTDKILVRQNYLNDYKETGTTYASTANHMYWELLYFDIQGEKDFAQYLYSSIKECLMDKNQKEICNNMSWRQFVATKPLCNVPSALSVQTNEYISDAFLKSAYDTVYKERASFCSKSDLNYEVEITNLQVNNLKSILNISILQSLQHAYQLSSIVDKLYREDLKGIDRDARDCFCYRTSMNNYKLDFTFKDMDLFKAYYYSHVYTSERSNLMADFGSFYFLPTKSGEDDKAYKYYFRTDYNIPFNLTMISLLRDKNE